ncbi:MAG TPA: Gfo/Idh/MocA family oxidoreductase [Planctomycetaceae bacterium]|nr:Gfo/Idh/MocA family oxidoreductase [Planctomycetaceae bacterium]
MSRKSTRRQFLHQSATLGTAFWVGSSARGWTQARSAIETIRFACIGVEGKGSQDRDDAGRHGEVAVLCDVDQEKLDKAAARFPKAKKYSDYRKMYDECAGDFDAITVSTPDHSHAPAAVRGMQLGKHCFCQKPLTYTVAEARMMRTLAAEKKLATQMGNQGTSYNGLREAVEIVRRGDLGPVKEVHVWTDRPIWPQGQGRPSIADPVPPHLNWNAFLGPAPERPYKKDAYHPINWRGWQDFGTGALGDMACHTMNMSVKALQLFDPISVEATPDLEWTGDARQESFPRFSVVKYEFGPRGGLEPCTLYWYDGGKRPPEELHAGIPQKASGSLVVGEKGSIYSDDDYHGKYTLLPIDKFPDFKKPDIAASPGHFTEFAMAIKEGKPELAHSNFDYAGRLTETVLLGNVALRSGKKVEWDAVNLRVKNDEAANRFVTREYRSGWGLS